MGVGRGLNQFYSREISPLILLQLHITNIPVSILYKSIAGRYRPVRVADGPITARYRFIKNASWDMVGTHMGFSTSSVKHYSETQITTNTVMKQIKALNGNLKPENKKITHRTTMNPITDLIVRRRSSETD